MRNDKHIAIRLRQEGKSYKEIRKELGVPLSTLSEWFSSLDWSNTVRLDLEKKLGNKLSIATKKRWERWHEAAREEGRKQYPELRDSPLFVAGLMLYWGEGDSKLANSMVRLSNTNPNMIRLFALFLQDICKIPQDRLKISLVLYPDLNDEECKEFWSKASGISISQFTKTQYIEGKHSTKRLSHGICSVVMCSRQLKEKIFVWIDMFQGEFPLKKSTAVADFPKFE